eukprot:scaffold736_cov197-Ochromonas_danica.AAC.1
MECLPGAEVPCDASEQKLFLSLVGNSSGGAAVAAAGGGGGGARIVALRFPTHEERDSFLHKLRALIIRLTSSSLTPSTTSSSSSTTTTASTGSATGHPIRRTSLTMNTITTPGIVVGTAGSIAAGGGDITPMQSNPMMQRSSRRMSLRDAVLEETIHSHPAAATSTSAKKPPTSSSSTTPPATMTAAGPGPGPGVADELQRQLREEKDRQERMKVQLMALNNELAEKDETIVALKKSEQSYEQRLQEREKMYMQDNVVRLQLGKRLEQVLMDKEEIVEQYNLLQ